MKRLLTTLAVVLCATIVWGQASDEYAAITAGDEYAIVKVGDKMPSFEVPMTDGTTIKSDELQGKVVLITLWASWCPSCRKEFSAIAKGALDSLLADERFVWLPIAREESLATVKGWFKKRDYDFVAGYDENRTIYSLFAEQEIPRNIVVDGDGNIIHHSSGYSKRDFPTVVAEIEKTLH